MWKNLLILVLAVLLILSWLRLPSGIVSEPTPTPVELPKTDTPDLPPSLYANLESTMEAMQADEGFVAASLGLSVFANTAAPVFSYHADEAMTPASTLKAVTSATALALLGKTHTFTTQLAASAPWALDTAGTFSGDLILVGGGDPMLTSETLISWVSLLKEKGLKKVEGRILADARYFPEQMTPNAWDWGDVSNYYGAGPCGLNLDFNRFEVRLKPGEAVGDSASMLTKPSLTWLEKDNLTTTEAVGTNAWASVYGGPYDDRLTFRGQVSLGGPGYVAEGAIPDPAYYAADRFKRLMEGRDIVVTGEPNTMRRLKGNGPLPDAKETLASHQSPSLLEIIRYLHRTSDNMVTESVFQELRKADPLGRPSKALIRTHWEKQGVPFLGLRMEDGSGLARADNIRPVDLAKVLWLSRSSSVGQDFHDSLNSYHSGRIRWKGGAMSRVRAYTGYTDHGYTFALMVNGYESNSKQLSQWRQRLMEDLLALPPL